MQTIHFLFGLCKLHIQEKEYIEQRENIKYINNEIMRGSGVDKLQQLQPLEKLKYVSKGTCKLFATQALSQTQEGCWFVHE